MAVRTVAMFMLLFAPGCDLLAGPERPDPTIAVALSVSADSMASGDSLLIELRTESLVDQDMRVRFFTSCWRAVFLVNADGGAAPAFVSIVPSAPFDCGEAEVLVDFEPRETKVFTHTWTGTYFENGDTHRVPPGQYLIQASVPDHEVLIQGDRFLYDMPIQTAPLQLTVY